MENEQMAFNRNGAYYLQLPYLNEEGNPKVVRLGNSFDAEQLCEPRKGELTGTHYCMKADNNSYIIVPQVEPTLNIQYQI